MLTIDEYKSIMKQLAITEHNKRIASVMARNNDKEIEIWNKAHNEFMEKLENDKFIRKLYFEYINKIK